MITLGLLLKVISPKESVGLSLEKSILIASIDKFNLERQFFPPLVSPPPIDPETSRQIVALRGR